MGIKYPAAQLDKKLFLQKMFIVPKAFMSWCSTIQNIIFPQGALIRINSLYGMQLNNQILSDEDQLFLAEQEFILLHEAGHIEHKDILNRFALNAALLAGLGLVGDKTAISYQLKLPENNELSIPVSRNYLIESIVLNFFLSRYNERNADKFAYTYGDDNALKGGISFFEKHDSLFDIENENIHHLLKQIHS